MDRTQVLGEGCGWVARVIVREWSTKTSVGYYTRTPCPARPGRMALDRAVQGQWPAGAQGHHVSWMSDHGGQPTARAFMDACRLWGFHPAVTSSHHPTGHADPERVRRTLNEACRWLQEWTGPCALGSALERWMTDDNQPDLHSTRGYQPPRPLERAYYSRRRTPFVAA